MNEDKTTEISLAYWFNVIDLDSNGIITLIWITSKIYSGHEMEYFYEEL